MDIWITTIRGRNLDVYENNVRTAIHESEAEAWDDLLEWCKLDADDWDGTGFDFDAQPSPEEAVKRYFNESDTPASFGIEQTVFRPVQFDRRVTELLEANNREVERRRKAEEACRQKDEALGMAARQFDFYEQSHLAKKTPESRKKAEVNRLMAATMNAHIGGL